VPFKYIRDTLTASKYLFQAYFLLEAAERTYHETENPPYIKLKRGGRRPRISKKDSMADSGVAARDDLMKELDAARKKRGQDDGIVGL
jgi:hypothetical protein